MENLNAEQIKKALECCLVECDCTGCPLHHQCETDCLKYAGVKALALIKSQEQRIKELSEEVESLKQAMEHEHASFMETFGEYGEKCERLTEENERLRAEVNKLDALTDEMGVDIDVKLKAIFELEDKLNAEKADVMYFKDQIRADTVRKMQDKVRQKIKKTDWLNGRAVYLEIDQIAKERLEDLKNERKD